MLVCEGNCSVSMKGNKMTVSKKGTDSTLDFNSHEKDVLYYYYKGMRVMPNNVMTVNNTIQNEKSKAVVYEKV